MTSVLSAFAAQAQFSYNNGTGEFGDLLIGLRSTNSGSSYDLLVDAGSITTFTSLTSGHSITIDPNFYTTSYLAYEGTNNVAWSAFACQRIPGPTGANNIWITRPRSNPNVQSTPWPCQNIFVQGSAASQIDSIGNDGVNIAGLGGSPASDATAVVEPRGGAVGSGSSFNSYTFMMSSTSSYQGLGNLDNNFWGDSTGLSVEQTTSPTFTSSGQPAIADFYQLLSTRSGQLGTYLGYFKYDTNGVMTYTAGPYIIPITPPVITSITRNGTSTTISFASIQGVTYNLVATNNTGISAARSTWPVIATPIVGDGGTDSFTDVTSDGTRFYAITAH